MGFLNDLYLQNLLGLFSDLYPFINSIPDDPRNHLSRYEQRDLRPLKLWDLMIDKKIITLLQSDVFKEYINYNDVKKVIEEVANINNIKSGLWRNPDTGNLEKKVK